jgi:hypothetical protein
VDLAVSASPVEAQEVVARFDRLARSLADQFNQILLQLVHEGVIMDDEPTEILKLVQFDLGWAYGLDFFAYALESHFVED